MLEVKPEAESVHIRSDPPMGLSIAEVARRTGVSAHTLRYYERAGLVVTTVDRTAGGQRRYQQLDLDWITVCTKLRATGMPIRTIRRYALLVSAGRGNEQERLVLMEAHRAEVIAKLAEIQENLELIDHKIDVYRGRLAAGDADSYGTPNPAGRGSSVAHQTVSEDAREPTVVRDGQAQAFTADRPELNVRPSVGRVR